MKALEFDWLFFNKRKLIGCHIVQFKVSRDFELVENVAQITELKMSDACYFLNTDKGMWLTYLSSSILPYVTQDEDNIIIEDKMIGLKFIILMKESVKNV